MSSIAVARWISNLVVPHLERDLVQGLKRELKTVRVDNMMAPTSANAIYAYVPRSSGAFATTVTRQQRGGVGMEKIVYPSPTKAGLFE